MKRVVTLQDISCLGKCSLTVALPIISALGVEAAIVPTAVFSTHTMFKDFIYRDLSEDIMKIASHWKKEDVKFDAIYTGYIANAPQLETVSEFIDEFKTDKCAVIVDPVMADNGKLYPAFDSSFVSEMAKFCSNADIIVPNMTEAAFLLGEEYVEEGYDEDFIKERLTKLCKLGCKKAVLTGVSFKKDKVGVMSYDSENDEYFSYFREKLPAQYHGTGDIFSSALVGSFVNGHSLEDSLKVAVDFTVECIRHTLNDKRSRWYGVNFEECLSMLSEN